MDDKQFTHYAPPQRRQQQQNIAPSAIKPPQLAQASLFNSNSQTIGPVSLANNASLSVQSVIANERNPNFRLGGVPYAIAFFQTSLTIAHLIGANITGSYTINGPLAMPVFTPYAAGSTAGGSDGNNLVFITELINKSGSPQTIYVVTNTRVYMPIGGGAG